jgi:DNA-binding NarL/FixJ family response regulator
MNAVPIRLMLVDDHAIVRSGFRRLLEQEPKSAYHGRGR